MRLNTGISLRHVGRYTGSTLTIAAIVALYFKWPHVNETTVALTLLVCILVVAARWGLRHSIYLSLLSAAAFNYFFLPPVFAFTIGDSRNWVALIAFLITGFIASQLAQRARDEAENSRHRQTEAERLYDISQQMLLAGNVIDLLNVMPQRIATTFNLDGAAVYLTAGERLYRSRPDYMDVSTAELRDAAFSRDHIVLEDRHLTLVPILLGTRTIGALAVTGGDTSPEVLDAISGLSAIAVERASAVETVARVEASRESERLRNALLDSVAHELRTPLTSITAAITTLRTEPSLAPAQAAELMEVIEEEAERLDRLVGQAMEMADLEAHEITLELRPHSIREAVDLAVDELQGPLATHALEIRLSDSLPAVEMDLERISKVIQHLLENAAKYSESTSPIYVSAEVAGGRLVTSIADRGVGVDDMEKSMIFDKFYRGQGQRYRVQGTGMGLAIAKAIVEAHGGIIDVTSQPGHGSVFSFSLPLRASYYHPAASTGSVSSSVAAG
jgi:two-component system sensor histidine kinase KdpD